MWCLAVVSWHVTWYVPDFYIYTAAIQAGRVRGSTVLRVLSSSMSVALFILAALLPVLSLPLLGFLCFAAYLYYVHWKYSHLPQPRRPSFFLGHVPDMIRTKDLSLVTVLQEWSEDVQSPTYVVFMLHQPVLITTDPENVKAVTMNPKISKDETVLKTFMHLMGQRFMGRGILTIPDYDSWKPRRQLYDPAFKKSYLKTLLEPFNEITTNFLDKLKPLADGVLMVPMKRHFGELTLDTINKVAFGSDFSQKMSSKELELKKARGYGFRTLVTMTSKGIDASIRNPAYQFLHPFEAAKYRDVVQSIRAIGRDCIKGRIQMIESGEQVPNDILTHILQIPSTVENVDIEELVDDFVTFYIGGQESTASMLTFALALTLLHPNVLDKVQSEVDEVLNDKDYVGADDLDKLEYMEQVFKETLRLCGPFSISTTRKALPHGMTFNGYHIPGGTQVMLSTAVMCHMPEYFDDPETFNPSRFDCENKQPSSFIYFPFGLGQRSCIGKHFAMMEAKIVFSRLLHKYRVTLPDGYQLAPVQRGIVQTKDDLNCMLEIREK